MLRADWRAGQSDFRTRWRAVDDIGIARDRALPVVASRLGQHPEPARKPAANFRFVARFPLARGDPYI